MVINVVAWIVLGLITGYIASAMSRAMGGALDIGLGIVGALVGGWIPQLGAPSPSGLDLWSAMVAVVGAVVFLFIGHGIRRSWASN